MVRPFFHSRKCPKARCSEALPCQQSRIARVTREEAVGCPSKREALLLWPSPSPCINSASVSRLRETARLPGRLQTFVCVLSLISVSSHSLLGFGQLTISPCFGNASHSTTQCLSLFAAWLSPVLAPSALLTVTGSVFNPAKACSRALYVDIFRRVKKTTRACELIVIVVLALLPWVSSTRLRSTTSRT